MLKLLKSAWAYLKGKIHITLTPGSPDRSVKTFKIRRIYPVFLTIFLITSIISLSFLYHHYKEEYNIADTKVENLRGVKAENKELKKELVALTKDTEEIRQAMVNLKNYNHNIKEMINNKSNNDNNNSDDENNVDMQLRTVISYNDKLLQQGAPIGGGDFRLLYQEPQDLIKSMQNNVNILNKEIPDQRKKLSNLEDDVEKHNAKLAATPRIWPVADKGKGYISSNFGWRNDPTTSEREFHEGLDIAVWYNTPVLATAYGTVSYSGWSGGYGWNIKIDHGFGYKTIYGHLNRIKVKEGEQVKRGQVIALSGNSGRSTGPHLHYEVRVNNSPKNPRDFIGR